MSCVVETDPQPDFTGTIRCATVPGVGLMDTWNVTVSGVPGAVYRQTGSAALSYACPQIVSIEGDGADGALTTGGQAVTIIGMQFGTAADNAVSLIAYGADNRYTAQNCRVIVDHTVIQCDSAPGVGAQLLWSVSIGNLSSRTPRTSYRPPVITSLTGPGAGPDAATTGDQAVFLHGTGFGSVEESAVDWVQYENINGDRSSEVYSPELCSVLVDDVTVMCTTAPGVGAALSWQISIAGQVSAWSTAVTSYGMPTIRTVLPVAPSEPRDMESVYVSTEGGTVLQVLGDNFGKAGDANIQVVADTRAITVTSLVYVGHHELQVRPQ